MQLEELGSSKDVPPLSCRGFFGLSTIVENRVAKLNENGMIGCDSKSSILPRSLQASGAHEVPD